MTNNKAPANIAVNTGESVTVQATDQETGATTQVTLTVDWVMAAEQPPDPGPGPDPEPEPIEGAAKWLAPLEATASSLETGAIAQVTAWGGDEYGYAYTYALDGAPMAVGIDSDTGRISLNSKLSVGDHSFTIVATNREDNTKTADFPFTLHVLQGITSGTPAANQILHKTFDPHSNTWGKPSGNNWTAVFDKMHTAIVDLQASLPDESLRVDIPLKRGTTYQYTNNQWLNGIQYFQVHDAGSGALPILQCTNTSTSDQAAGATNMGPSAGYGQSPSGLSPHDAIGPLKSFSAPIATVAAGSTTVTLRNASDASKIKVGRWHLVAGWMTQFVTFPPNFQFIDYVKVTNISGTTVTLDRPLKYGYDQTWWEPTTGQYAGQNFGFGRLIPWDTGGEGGYIPADPRVSIRSGFTNINFPQNPSAASPTHGRVVGVAYVVDMTIKGCTIGTLQAGACKHLTITGCTPTYAWELDKGVETCLIDGHSSAGHVIGGATGYQYLLFRDSELGFIQTSPRQLRAISTSFSTQNDPPPGGGGIIGLAVTWGIYGSLYWYDFGMAGPCTFSNGPTIAGTNNASLTLGSEATWNGDQLQIPTTTSSPPGGLPDTERWLGWAVPGAIVSVASKPPFTDNWGYIASAGSPGDATALWLDIVWVAGSKPTSGKLYIQQARRLYFAEGNTLADGATFASPKFVKQTAPGRDGNWNFPQGYPPELAG